MKKTIISLALASIAAPVFANDNAALLLEIKRLQEQTQALQKQLVNLQNQVISNKTASKAGKASAKVRNQAIAARQAKRIAKAPKAPPQIVEEPPAYHSSLVSVHIPQELSIPPRYYPLALVADNKVLTYIAGTPIVSSPYTGERPAFDGSDYIVNISSINRDIRLMEQRRRFYNAYEHIGYPAPSTPIIALSGKAEAVGVLSDPYFGHTTGDLSLGASEVDVAAALNHVVEAFISLAYDDSPPASGGPRVSNSAFDLNLGFVNIGDLDRSPFYFTAGQLYAPFGRYSSSMVSSPIPLSLGRTLTRPFILGYKSQEGFGPYAALYTFIPDTDLGNSPTGGFNLGYTLSGDDFSGDIGAGIIGTITDSSRMQLTGAAPFTTFGGFGSVTNGSEIIKKVPGIDFHANVSFSRYSLTAEWVGTTRAFQPYDLSFNGEGARPQAGQLEAGVTFRAWDKPASFALGYQWSKDTLALNLPEKRIAGVFSISIWRDTVESLEFRHDRDFSTNNYANGSFAPGEINFDTYGTGRSANTLLAQIGVYF